MSRAIESEESIAKPHDVISELTTYTSDYTIDLIAYTNDLISPGSPKWRPYFTQISLRKAVVSSAKNANTRQSNKHQ